VGTALRGRRGLTIGSICGRGNFRSGVRADARAGYKLDPLRHAAIVMLKPSENRDPLDPPDHLRQARNGLLLPDPLMRPGCVVEDHLLGHHPP
jgi:hypothetical protein